MSKKLKLYRAHTQADLFGSESTSRIPIEEDTEEYYEALYNEAIAAWESLYDALRTQEQNIEEDIGEYFAHEGDVYLDFFMQGLDNEGVELLERIADDDELRFDNPFRDILPEYEELARILQRTLQVVRENRSYDARPGETEQALVNVLEAVAFDAEVMSDHYGSVHFPAVHVYPNIEYHNDSLWVRDGYSEGYLDNDWLDPIIKRLDAIAYSGLERVDIEEARDEAPTRIDGELVIEYDGDYVERIDYGNYYTLRVDIVVDPEDLADNLREFLAAHDNGNLFTATNDAAALYRAWLLDYAPGDVEEPDVAGVPADVADDIFVNAVELGLISDERFAQIRERKEYDMRTLDNLTGLQRWPYARVATSGYARPLLPNQAIAIARAEAGDDTLEAMVGLRALATHDIDPRERIDIDAEIDQILPVQLDGEKTGVPQTIMRELWFRGYDYHVRGSQPFTTWGYAIRMVEGGAIVDTWQERDDLVDTWNMVRED